MNKIIVKYDPWGRMGNRMFMYAFGRILAEERESEFYADPIHNFPNTLNHKKTNEHNTLLDPITTKTKYGNHYADIPELMNTNSDIIVNSFLQKAEYYINFRDDIKKWFELDISSFVLPIADELVVHIRETDYIMIGKYLSQDYYKDQIKNSGITNVTIVTDNCESEFIKQLQSIGYKILSWEPIRTFSTVNDPSAIQDYIYMLYAKHLILSQSTFSWWPAFLGDHETVIFPVSNKNNSLWRETPKRDDINLYVDGFHRVVI